MKHLLYLIVAATFVIFQACKKTETSSVITGSYSVAQNCGAGSGNVNSTVEAHEDVDSIYINVVYGATTYKTVAWFYYTNYTIKAPEQVVNGVLFIEGEGNYNPFKQIMNFNYTLQDSTGINYCGSIWTKQ